MKASFLSLIFASLFSLSAQADFTIVQKMENKGQASEMTLKVKGERVRMEATPEMTMIVESKTGDMVTLINAQKKFMRISGDKAKAIAEMAAPSPVDLPVMVGFFVEPQHRAHDSPLVIG